MIYTVTFSPCLDYILYVPELTLGAVCRSEREQMYPGGKGINVSIMLSNLGLESKSLGFAAGFTGKALETMLEAHACETDFIWLPEGDTRINVKLKSKQESDINGQGPDIPAESLEALFGKLDALKSGDVLVLAGAIPSSLPGDIYEKILRRLEGKGIQFVVDATNDLLKNVLSSRPFLIKPNHHELGDMFGVKLETLEEIVHYAKQAQKLGARNVLVSMAGDGAVLVTETGTIFKSKPPKGRVVNSVGAGDSMVAGFLAGWSKTGDYAKAFAMGLAAGSASAFQEWLAGRAEVDALLKQIQV